MGEGTARMRDERFGEDVGAPPMVRADATAPDPEREATAGELEKQIESLRAEIGELVQELDRRRHEVLDVRLQVRRHAGAITIAVTCVAALIAGRIALRRRRANDVLSRGQNLIRVLAFLSKEDPSEVLGAIRGRAEFPVLGALARLAAGVITRQRHRP
jgi:hypothetical protein